VKKLDLSFYATDAVTVAQQLIGCYLVRDCEAGRIIGRINEVEAYISAVDKASHAWGNKRTVRNEPMFRTGGIAHVYFIYGMHNCLNVVTGPEDEASAVLVRGVEIVSGKDIAAQNRHGKDFADLTRAQQKNLSNGPGKLCRALDIDRSFDFHPLTGEKLYICETIETFDKTVTEIVASKRIGIDYAEEAVDFLWRFTG
jgi:DNA-3-methyladenine glycosylase (3mg)